MSRDFWLLVFFMNQFPPSTWVHHFGHFKFFWKFSEIFTALCAPLVSLTLDFLNIFSPYLLMDEYGGVSPWISSILSFLHIYLWFEMVGSVPGFPLFIISRTLLESLMLDYGIKYLRAESACLDHIEKKYSIYTSFLWKNSLVLMYGVKYTCTWGVTVSCQL